MSTLPPQVFLSYSRNDLPAASQLRATLMQKGLAVFKDDDSIRRGDEWVWRLQEGIQACSVFLILVGRDGLREWMRLESGSAIARRTSASSLCPAIVPVLLDDTGPEALPLFLAGFQCTRWRQADLVPEQLIDEIVTLATHFVQAPPIEGNPFRGLDAFTLKDAHLYFGRRREIREALERLLGVSHHAGPQDRSRPLGKGQYFRWLQIQGDSGSGKSSLVQAGLLPMIAHGALANRTGVDTWHVLGPMRPGTDPVNALASVLARDLPPGPRARPETANAWLAELDHVHQNRTPSNLTIELDARLDNNKATTAGFLLIVDQFEELLTVSEAARRSRFDALLAHCLTESQCPFMLISTVRSDFLGEIEKLPALQAAYNTVGTHYVLGPISDEGLRDIIERPARLANLDVSEVTDAIILGVPDRVGALPLAENALDDLWNNGRHATQERGSFLSGTYLSERGGPAGLLASKANDMLGRLEADRPGKGSKAALELLLRLVNINPGGNHTRRRIPYNQAVLNAGNGDEALGKGVVQSLAGARLITISTEAGGQFVDLIHETLIRTRIDPVSGKPEAYWPTFHDYIEVNRDRDQIRQQLAIEARRWQESRRFGRWWNLAVLGDYLRYRQLPMFPKSPERRFLTWSLRALVTQTALVIAALISLVVLAEAAVWAMANKLPPSYILHKPLWFLGFGPLPEMVQIKPGRFTMGCKKGRDDVEGAKCEPDTSRPVTVDKPFSLGKYEVTFLQYDYYVWDQKLKGKGEQLSYPDDAGWGREHRPVINVSWDDAQAYLSWLAKQDEHDDGTVYRLPTEVEWEYAARGGLDTPYGWADQAFDATKANCDVERGAGKTLPVNREGNWRNGFGLHDMIGDVWEWTEDQVSVDRESRGLRGGAWDLNPDSCRAAVSISLATDGRDLDIGFRVCRGSPIETRDAATLGR